MFGAFCRSSLIPNMEACLRFVRRATKTTGKSLNTHISNRAKRGLFHGKDVRFGNSISHSGKRHRRKWSPNVINKRVWSDALDNWIRFKMTTRALKEIDNYGGIDNYILRLDERSVSDSRKIFHARNLIASTLYHKGELSEFFIKKMGYHKTPPAVVEKHQWVKNN